MRITSPKALAALLLTAGVLVPLVAASPALATDEPVELALGKPSVATEVNREKIDVLSIWAHPDDDAGTVTPCGVWHDKFDVRCGIVMATRGEGGSNSVGPEAGPDLGLRRENEDRTSHVRSGTVDIFNLDRVDFYYNTSAPLTAEVWDAEETLRRTVRVIRETQPEILLGATPSMVVGHGNHQYAQGRMVWEAALAAADPARFPEQLRGFGSVEPWQVSRVLSGGWGLDLGGSGASAGPDCNVSFSPKETVPFTVVGTWTGYDSPYTWPAGNVQGAEAGTAKTWAQAGREGYAAHPTQARSMVKNLVDPTCQQYGVTYSRTPMQPNGSAANGDEALLYGSVIADPGGMPLGSEFYLETNAYYNGDSEPFDVTVSARSGGDTVAAGSLELQLPDGWTATPAQQFGPITSDATATATFTVTPAGSTPGAVSKIGATFTAGDVSAYNDTRVALTAGVEGRFQRWGNFAEYEQWTEANNAYVGGRSDAVASIGTGESITLPVEVTNRTAGAVDAEVSVAAPAGFALDSATQQVTGISPAGTEVANFVLTHTDPEAQGGTVEELVITTTSAGSVTTEKLKVYLVPSTVIPQLSAAPELGGGGAEFTTSLDISRKWEGADCAPNGTDCGAGSTAQLGWFDDALYARVTVVDDVASAAVTPDRCFGHWLVDSVELLLDPSGNAVDTSSTFKLGVFPFTDDAAGSNGNGVNGACWSRDADNHQGFSTGPLAETVVNAPNAPGVEVVATAERVDGRYVEGRYTVDVKIPLAALPAAIAPASQAPTGDAATNEVDPVYLGLNVTPYDSDTQDFIGQTRTAWSPFGSQQSEPYRWGHGYLEGYTPPADRPLGAGPALIPATALQGVESPQTIFQSATRGGTISGLQPSDAMTVASSSVTPDAITLTAQAAQPGTARAFLWQGDPSYIPVWTSSCEGDEFGFSACDPSDGAATPWGDTMGGRLLGSATVEVGADATDIVIPLGAETHAAIAAGAQVLISYSSGGAGAERAAAGQQGVNAWAFPVVTKTPEPEVTPPGPETKPPGGKTPPGEKTPPGDGVPPRGDDTPRADNLSDTGGDFTLAAVIAALLLAAGAGTIVATRRVRAMKR
ncbi:hypothetical protein ACIFOC_03071 [Leucobacter aridicollis]|uniref:PIG-L family deacetylase n=1 Tax=Leucobacter aridicollis TaxID=283878 RepID=UPI0037CAC83D